MKLSEHFDSREFDCKGEHCGCGGLGRFMDMTLINLLEELRAVCGGYPLIIASGYRCFKHNFEVGGVYDSQHTKHTAADILCPQELAFDEFVWNCRNVYFCGHRVDGVGLYPNQGFVHLDVRHGGWGPRVEW